MDLKVRIDELEKRVSELEIGHQCSHEWVLRTNLVDLEIICNRCGLTKKDYKFKGDNNED